MHKDTDWITDKLPDEDQWIELYILSRFGETVIKAKRIGLNWFETWDVRVKDKVLGWR